jgi:hypothetical protein
MLFYRSKAIALYVAWKTIEIACRRGVESGTVPEVRKGSTDGQTIES